MGRPSPPSTLYHLCGDGYTIVCVVAEPPTLTAPSLTLLDRLPAWSAMMADMGRSDDPQAVLKSLAQGARRVLGAQYSAVMTTAETPGVVEIRAVSGVPLQYLPIVEKVWGRLIVGARITLSPQGLGPLSLAFFQKRDIFITEWLADLAAFPGANLLWRTVSEALNVRALWCLPLALSPADEPLGLIVLGRTESQPPPSDDRDFAMVFAAQAALAVKSARRYESEHDRRRVETQQRTLAEAQQQMAATTAPTSVTLALNWRCLSSARGG